MKKTKVSQGYEPWSLYSLLIHFTHSIDLFFISFINIIVKEIKNKDTNIQALVFSFVIGIGIVIVISKSKIKKIIATIKYWLLKGMVKEFVLSNPDSNIEFLDCFSFSMEDIITQVIRRIVVTKIVEIVISIGENLIVTKECKSFFLSFYYLFL